MTRDFHLMRKILLAIEDGFDPLSRRGAHDAATVQAHCLLLVDVGAIVRIEGLDMGCMWRLTMHGHDVANLLRNPEVWASVQASLAAYGGLFWANVLQLAQQEHSRRNLEAFDSKIAALRPVEPSLRN